MRKRNIAIISALLFFAVTVVCLIVVKRNTVNIKKIIRDPNPYAIEVSEDLGGHFIYHDRIYYLKRDVAEDSGKDSTILYSMNFEGKNNSRVLKSEVWSDADFCYAYDNSVYFRDRADGDILRIDLNTKAISRVGNEVEVGEYIPNSLNNGKIYTLSNDPAADRSVLRCIDLKDFTIISETVTWKEAWRYYIDDKTSDIYYLTKPVGDSFPGKSSLYRNNDYIMDIAAFENDDTAIMAYYDRCVYLQKLGHVYKIDALHGIYMGEVTLNEDIIPDTKISGSNSNGNYYYWSGAIYLFDAEHALFEPIAEDVWDDLSCIYNTERKSIFIGFDKFRRNPMRQVIIYDKQNDHFEKYDDVKECFVDENKLYMLYVSRRDVAVRSCSLSD